MHLSKLTLNPRSPAVRRDTSNPYEMHRTLARVLEGEPEFRWRLEDTMLLVQSATRPDWGQLEPNYLLKPSESKAFNLDGWLANPTVVRSIPKAQRELRASGKAKTGKREGLYKLEDQMQWFERLSGRNGFEPLDFMVSFSDTWRVFKDHSGPPITLAVAGFDGRLRITDAALFRQTLERGVGHAKALGLGLLSVAPG
jgi:CRISPR system Cascade subunit CasE